MQLFLAHPQQLGHLLEDESVHLFHEGLPPSFEAGAFHHFFEGGSTGKAAFSFVVLVFAFLELLRLGGVEHAGHVQGKLHKAVEKVFAGTVLSLLSQGQECRTVVPTPLHFDEAVAFERGVPQPAGLL